MDAGTGDAMSHLRDIMQRLGAEHEADAGGLAALEQEKPSALRSVLQEEAYRSRLESCSEPMLLYEWNWLELHLEDLRLCRRHEDMRKAAGGARHLEALIAAAERQQEHLAAMFAERNLLPRRLPHSVAPGEHAWELSNGQLRAQWGLAGSPP